MKKNKFSKIISSNECLYRYRSVNEENIKALSSGRLYFSKVGNFNDPYDSLLFINTKTVVDEILGNIYIGMADYIKKMRIQGHESAQLVEVLWSNKKSQDIIMRRHFELICDCLDGIRKMIKHNPRIICFSENYDSLLMWSHYADNHKGYVLVYDKESIESASKFSYDGDVVKQKTKLEKVNYVTKQVDMTEEAIDYIRNNMLENMGDIETHDATMPPYKIRQILTEKAKDWEYEEEWRLIPRITKLDEESRLGYIEIRPKAVIFGSQTKEEDVEQIKEICAEKNIPVYRIFLSETSPDFCLKIGDDGELQSV